MRASASYDLYLCDTSIRVCDQSVLAHCDKVIEMNSLALIAIVASIAVAEPPPSNSYLPPSANGRGSGYPQGGPVSPSFSDGEPQVVAARNFQGQGHGHGHGQGGHASHSANGGHGSGFARSNGHDHAAQARFGGQDQHQGYDRNAGAFGRNALDELSGEPANYNFGYMVNDFQEGTDFGHHEERQEERAQGEYHVVLPDGRKQTVSYEADQNGFKPRVSYQDTGAGDLSRSGGYDSNANNVRNSNHGNGFNHGGHSNHGNSRSNGY